MTDAAGYLKQAALYSDEVDYVMLQLPARAITLAAGILAEISQPFGALIIDKDEVTLFLPAEVVEEEFAGRLRDAKRSDPLRLITLDVPLPPDLTGFMALVADLLAGAGIPIIPLGAFERDHLLVPAAHFERAMQVLKDSQ